MGYRLIKAKDAFLGLQFDRRIVQIVKVDKGVLQVGCFLPRFGLPQGLGQEPGDSKGESHCLLAKLCCHRRKTGQKLLQNHWLVIRFSLSES